MSAATRRSLWLTVLAGAVIAMITTGNRYSFGLFLAPMSQDMGWGREVFAFAAGLSVLLMGLGTPFAGVISDRYGARTVVWTGMFFYAAGLYWMSQVSTPLGLTLSAGWLVGIGTSMTGMVIMVGAVARVVPAHQRSQAVGIVSAGGSAGQMLVLPVWQVVINYFGWSTALLAMSASVLLLAPIALSFRRMDASGASAATDQKFSTAMKEAGTNRGFLLLTTGFFVCGFHVFFIATHLPAWVQDEGLGATTGATALVLVGLLNIVGSFTWGWLGGRYSKKLMLSIIYGTRALAFLGLLLLPVTHVTVYAFAVVQGFLYLGTVPLTSGLVGQIFGVQYLSTLFGITFVSHQVGGFLGAWLGGYLFDATGSYDLMWWAMVAMGVFGALVNLPIDERALRPETPAPQPV